MNPFDQGEGTRTRNRPIFRCANKVDVVTEDDSVDGDVTDDGGDLEAAADDAIDADVGTEDELESSLPEDVEWIKQQPLPYPLVCTQCRSAKISSEWNDR